MESKVEEILSVCRRAIHGHELWDALPKVLETRSTVETEHYKVEIDYPLITFSRKTGNPMVPYGTMYVLTDVS